MCVRPVRKFFVSSVTLYFKNPLWKVEKGWVFKKGNKELAVSRGGQKIFLQWKYLSKIFTKNIFVKNTEQNIFDGKFVLNNIFANNIWRKKYHKKKLKILVLTPKKINLWPKIAWNAHKTASVYILFLKVGKKT